MGKKSLCFPTSTHFFYDNMTRYGVRAGYFLSLCFCLTFSVYLGLLAAAHGILADFTIICSASFLVAIGFGDLCVHFFFFFKLSF